jgi:hypothetical protein
MLSFNVSQLLGLKWAALWGKLSESDGGKLQESWVWWCRAVITVLWRLRQEDLKSQGNLGCLGRPCLRTPTHTPRKWGGSSHPGEMQSTRSSSQAGSQMARELGQSDCSEASVVGWGFCHFSQHCSHPDFGQTAPFCH